MADEQKTFKISGIGRIQNIDDDDLLLVADREGGSYQSHSMTIQQLVGKVVQSILSSQQVADQISAVATQAVLDAGIPEVVMNTIRLSADTVLDVLDGVEDGAFTMDGN